MIDPHTMARFIMDHQEEYSIKGNRPVYTCGKCGKTKERQPGDLETAPCPKCDGTMHVHFTKEKTGP